VINELLQIDGLHSNSVHESNSLLAGNLIVNGCVVEDSSYIMIQRLSIDLIINECVVEDSSRVLFYQ